jgi:hypothetical protein
MPTVLTFRVSSAAWLARVLVLGLLCGCSADIEKPRSPFTVGSPITGGAGTGGAVLPGQPCPLGQQNCNGFCVDTTANPGNCGTCGNVCPAGSTCSAGTCGCAPGQMLCNGTCGDPVACSCPSGWSFCNGMCSDVMADAANCGMCGRTCATGEVCDAGMCRSPDSNACTDTCGGGRTCQAGTCVCPPMQEFCAGACTDTQTSDEHCGACDAACTGGKVCEAGSCTCSPTQTECGTECVDLQTSLAHCGMCDHACMAGDACTAGRCAGPTGDDGCMGEALGVTIAQVAAYQSIKIPIAMGMQPVGESARVADVVQGRETLFRVFVTVDSGFAPRELSARLTLINGADEQQYFAKQMISGNSSDANTASAFQIYVPPEEIQADTRYAVEIVECTTTGSGMLRAPRFPASGDTALEARQTGVLKIAIVPIVANSITPDTSETALAVYRDYFMAMYPTTEVEFTVLDPINTNTPVNWSGTLEQVRRQRQTDAPAADVYYYGFLKPAATLREFCRGGCTAGVGYVGDVRSGATRVSIGLAYADEGSAEIMAHEVGHNHGRNHAPCAPGGQISGVDGQFPHDGARLGVWGYDHRERELIDPNEATDIMGYCDAKWISDYTYKGLVERVAAVNGAPLQLVSPEQIAQWLVMLVDDQGSRWSLPFTEPGEAFGKSELAEILDENGDLADYATVYRTEISDIGAATLLVPPPQPGWHYIRVQGAAPLAFSEPVSVPEP